MTRRRPSGVGSNSRRFADILTPEGQKLKVPVAKDVGTFLFLSADGENWSTKYHKILDGAYDLQVGAFIELEGMTPGEGMGEVVGAQIVRVKVRVCIDPGKRYSQFAQLKRLVYAVLLPNEDEMGEISP